MADPIIKKATYKKTDKKFFNIKMPFNPKFDNFILLVKEKKPRNLKNGKIKKPNYNSLNMISGPKRDGKTTGVVRIGAIKFNIAYKNNEYAYIMVVRLDGEQERMIKNQASWEKIIDNIGWVIPKNSYWNAKGLWCVLKGKTRPIIWFTNLSFVMKYQGVEFGMPLTIICDEFHPHWKERGVKNSFDRWLNLINTSTNFINNNDINKKYWWQRLDIFMIFNNLDPTSNIFIQNLGLEKDILNLEKGIIKRKVLKNKNGNETIIKLYKPNVSKDLSIEKSKSLIHGLANTSAYGRAVINDKNNFWIENNSFKTINKLGYFKYTIQIDSYKIGLWIKYDIYGNEIYQFSKKYNYFSKKYYRFNVDSELNNMFLTNKKTNRIFKQWRNKKIECSNMIIYNYILEIIKTAPNQGF